MAGLGHRREPAADEAERRGEVEVEHLPRAEGRVEPEHVALGHLRLTAGTSQAHRHVDDLTLGRGEVVTQADDGGTDVVELVLRGAHDVCEPRQGRRGLVGGQVRRLAEVDHGAREVGQVLPADAELTRSLSHARDLGGRAVLQDEGTPRRDREVNAVAASVASVANAWSIKSLPDRSGRKGSRAAKDAGVRHLILISVVGADAMPIGYFRAKAKAESAIEESGVPWTVLRAAQLHEFVLPVIRGLSRLPLLMMPGGLQFEPVHVDEVATRLAEITLGSPAGRVADIAGPEVLNIRQLADAYADATGRRSRPGLPVRMPGAVGRAYRAGSNLASAPAQRGQRGWSEFLQGLQEQTGVRAG